MRVLASCHEFPPRTGGAIACFDMMAALADFGVEPAVFCATYSDISEPKSTTQFFEWNGVSLQVFSLCLPVHSYPAHERQMGFRMSEGISAIETAFQRVVVDFTPDLVHFYHFFGQSMRVLELLKKLCIPTVFTLLDYFSFCFLFVPWRNNGEGLCNDSDKGAGCSSCVAGLLEGNGGFAADDAQLARRRVMVFDLLDMADYLVSPSRYLRERYLVEDAGRFERIQLITHGLMPNPQGYREDISPVAHTFGYFGGKSPLKGFDVLLEAIKRLPDMDITLRIMDPWTGPSPTITDPRIRYEGYIPRNDVWSVYRELDVVLHPSFTEVYPTVLREAYAAGIPVIAADNTGLLELVEHERNGLLFSTGDADSLAAAITRLATDERLYARLTEGVRQHPPKHIREEAREYFALYAGCL